MKKSLSKPTILFDFSMTLLFPNDKYYQGGLNALHNQKSGSKNYHFMDYFYLNEEVLKFIKNNQDKADYYIFTTGSVQDTQEVQDKISGLFTDIYTVPQIGIVKTDPDAYYAIAKDIGTDPANITFIDDSHSNVAAAKEAGLNIIHFTRDNASLITKLKKIISTDE